MNCEVTVSSCASNPCQNGGLCLQASSTGGYTCTCLNGIHISTKKNIC